MSNLGSFYPTEQIVSDSSYLDEMQLSSPLRLAAQVSSIQPATPSDGCISRGPYKMTRYRPHSQYQVRSPQEVPKASICAGGNHWWCCQEIANQHAPVGANIIGYDACPGCGHWRCAACPVR